MNPSTAQYRVRHNPYAHIDITTRYGISCDALTRPEPTLTVTCRMSSTTFAITSAREITALTAVGHGRSPGSIGVSVARTAAFRASLEEVPREAEPGALGEGGAPGEGERGSGDEARDRPPLAATPWRAALVRRPRLRLRCANSRSRVKRSA